MKKILAVFVLGVMILISLGFVSACHDGDTECTPIEQTLIKGEVTYADSGDEAGKATVEVTCFHEGTEYTRITSTHKYGAWKGWYFVYFPQSQCVAGDKVMVKATKGDLTGSMEGLVEDFTSGKCFDLDLARVDIPLVPEFGTFMILLTALGAVGIFFVVRGEIR